MGGRRRAGWLLLIALVGGALAATPAGPAAANPPSVAVPRHLAPRVALSLVGATPEAVAVQFGDEYGLDDYPSVFSGRPGAGSGDVTDLTRRPVLGRHDEYVYYQRLGVFGRTLYWYGEINRTSTSPARYIMHRTDLLTGADVTGEVTLRPTALAGPDAWLGWKKTDLIRVAFADGARSTVATGETNYLSVLADAGGALITSLSPDAGMQTRRYRMDLVTFATGSAGSAGSAGATVQRMVDSLDLIGSIGLSADTVAWTSRDQNQPPYPATINQRPRAGGSVSSYRETSNFIADQVTLAVGSGTVGYLLTTLTDTTLVVTSALGPTRHVPMPFGASGLAAVGDRFVTAAGGPVATAGVYSVPPSATSAGAGGLRVATIPTPEIAVTSLAFTNSRLYYVDRSDDSQPGLPIFTRPVSGAATPEIGAETTLAARASMLRDIPSGSISFSAGRGSFENPDDAKYQWVFTDRGQVTGRADQERPDESDSNGLINDIHPVTSGPYTLVRGRVYRPDGTLLFTRPGAGSVQSARDDLYGSGIIYSLADFRAGTNTIWLRDVAAPRSPINPAKLATYRCTATCPRRVAVWNGHVAWQLDSHRIRVGVLVGSGGASLGDGHGEPPPSTDTLGVEGRDIEAGGPIQQLVLGDGVLAWQAGYSTGLLDLTSPTAKPLHLAGRATDLALDDHRLARRVVDTGRIVVYRLPFGGAHPPGLLGTLAPAGFTPNGDGKGDTWRPQFDTTKPLTGVRLRILSPTRNVVFRTLTGTGPDGSIRDLVWDGRSGAGTRLKAGTYRWLMQAAAADGEGPLGGRAWPVRGTVTVRY